MHQTRRAHCGDAKDNRQSRIVHCSDSAVGAQSRSAEMESFLQVQLKLGGEVKGQARWQRERKVRLYGGRGGKRLGRSLEEPRGACRTGKIW
jgi:hypothetical protein